MLLKSWGAALALSLAFMSGVVQAQVVLPGGVTTPGGQPVGVVPMAIINPNDGATCIVGNTGCPSIGGGTGGTVTVTNAFNLETTQVSVNQHLANIETGLSSPPSVQGVAAQGSSDTDIPLNDGCRAASTAPTAVADGQKVVRLCSLDGRAVTLPYSIKELMVRGSVTVTNAASTILAAPGASLNLYVTAAQCTNSSATGVTLTFNDSASTILYVPPGGGFGFTFPTPLVSNATNTAFTATGDTTQTTVKCAAQGYKGN
jgi:hypothetical protein